MDTLKITNICTLLQINFYDVKINFYLCDKD